MRSIKRTAALVIFTLLLSLFPAAAAENEETELIWMRETEITQDIQMVESVFLNGARQAEHYISYRPGGVARPALAYGESIREKLVFPEATEKVEDRILAGINGDYFVMATGMPLGIVIHGEELISSDAGNAAFGFLEDGSAILGMPGLTMALSGENLSLPISSLNKNYKSGLFCLYTTAWGEYAPLSEDYWCVELLPDEGQVPMVGCDLSCTIRSVRHMEDLSALEEGTLLLCYAGPEEAWENAGLESLESGTELTLSIRAGDERFTSCREALGCLYPLIREGEILPDLDKLDHNKAPRSAIGICEDGTVILYTADGRQYGYAIGLTLTEVAGRLLELGCVEAGALDGGASTVLACQLPGEESPDIQNAPSLGTLRETPQFLLLTAPDAPAGEVRTVGVYCEDAVILAGSSCQLRCGGCDEAGAPVEISDPAWSADLGTVDAAGVYTAPEEACEDLVTVICGETFGALRLPVITEPDRISLLREDSDKELRKLRVLPGSVTELTAQAYWNQMKACSEDELFAWSLEGEIGGIDETGCFTASQKAATGYISVQYGETVCRVQVDVTDSVICAEDFEHAEPGFAPGLQWRQETNRDKVKFGSGSLRLDYDLSEGFAELPMEAYPTELGDHAGFWLLSDGSGNKVYSVHEGYTLLLGTMDHQGWMYFAADTLQVGRIDALQLSGSGSGTVWLDQLVVFSDIEPDLEAPVIRMEAEDGYLTARVWDWAEGILSAELLRLTVDGEPYLFEYDPLSGVVTAPLPESGHSSRICLTAWDRSGNYNSASLLLEAPQTDPFPDMTGHWAQPYVEHLHSLGVLAGRLAEDGTTYYDPNSKITRAEFAVMLCRWLHIDTSAYESAVSFADEDSIPEWARDSVGAAAALKLIQGASNGQGLIFMPQEPLTRAQAAVILGRTMPGGRMQADLPWPDAGDIPEWARTYVSELAFMGVMTGDGEKFDPNGPLTRAQAAKLLSELT